MSIYIAYPVPHSTRLHGSRPNRSHIKNNKKLLRYKKTQTKAKQTTNKQKGRGYGTVFGKSPSAQY